MKNAFLKRLGIYSIIKTSGMRKMSLALEIHDSFSVNRRKSLRGK
jgi:hypothetical protein